MGTAAEPLILLDQVQASYTRLPFVKHRQVLRGLDLAVPAGRIAGLLGANGSGKTTALRVAAGILVPNRGTARVAGAPAGSMHARNHLGYMPEHPGFPGTLKPKEILRFMGGVFGMDALARDRRCAELGELLGFKGYLDRKMSGLSKGMSKRIALAAALFPAPAALLLDEPIEGIDPLGAASIKNLLREIAGQGAAILISSHVLADMEDLCDEIFLLHQGKTILQGPLEAILAAKDRMRISFTAPEERRDELLVELRNRIEAGGGVVHEVGAAREGLESIFRRQLGVNSEETQDA